MPFFSGQAVLLTGSWSGATALPVPLTHPEHATPYRTHVLLRCLIYAQPAQLALDALVLSRVCKSTAQHMGCRAHTEILNRNLAYLAGLREK